MLEQNFFSYDIILLALLVNIIVDSLKSVIQVRSGFYRIWVLILSFILTGLRSIICNPSENFFNDIIKTSVLATGFYAFGYKDVMSFILRRFSNGNITEPSDTTESTIIVK